MHSAFKNFYDSFCKRKRRPSYEFYIFDQVFTVFDADYSQYALKYVNVRDADASVFQSYVNEITLLKRLQGHESIIRLYDW